MLFKKHNINVVDTDELYKGAYENLKKTSLEIDTALRVLNNIETDDEFLIKKIGECRESLVENKKKINNINMRNISAINGVNKSYRVLMQSMSKVVLAYEYAIMNNRRSDDYEKDV